MEIAWRAAPLSGSCDFILAAISTVVHLPYPRSRGHSMGNGEAGAARHIRYCTLGNLYLYVVQCMDPGGNNATLEGISYSIPCSTEYF